jgi:hypothetical protein
MPAHRKHFVLDSRFQATQKLLQIFMDRGFNLIYSNQYNQREYQDLNKRLVSNTETYSTHHELGNIDEGFEFITTLLSSLNSYLKLHSTSDIRLIGEWNYLGQKEEREAYLSHIDTLFWTYQDREELTTHPKFMELTENPWKLIRLAPEFDFTIPTPGDNFQEATVGFVERLMIKLNGWDLSPFLIQDIESNFHWRITLNGASLINGTIAKIDNGALVHRSEFDA